MEHKFKNILQKTKAWQEGREPLARTFEGALFSDTNWPLTFQDEDHNPTAVKRDFSEVKTSVQAAPTAETNQAQNSEFKILVMFLGDNYSEGKGKEDLLGKMIGAMKLQSKEYIRIKFNEALDEILDPEQNSKNPSPETLDLYQQIIEHRPQFVVTLGATVTNILLGKREKLSGIHGHFFEKALRVNEGSHTFTWSPVFHPDFLIINPNMKRTAWIDLQKVMERIGKN